MGLEVLDGHQYQLVLVRDQGTSKGRLSDDQALQQRGETVPKAAMWLGQEGWQYAETWQAKSKGPYFEEPYFEEERPEKRMEIEKRESSSPKDVGE